MATPILTKKQTRQSLSAKKGPAKGLRNILAQPVESYWPIVNINQYPTLTTIMNELLSLIKRPTFKIPGSMLRHTPKEKRILVRKEALEKETAKPDENILKSVILGVNAVTRALEKNDVCCILLDANVEPPLLIKHIIVMAQNKKVPILLLPILKTVTLEKIGFATIAFALKHDVMKSSDNVFYKLYESIAEVFKNFEPPPSLQLFKPDETSEESTMCKAEIASTDCDPIPNTSKLEKPVIVFTDVYKYRSSRKERAFIPPTENVNKNSEASQIPSDEFIALSNDDLGPVIDKNSTKALKSARYINICNEVKDEPKNIEKDAKSFNESEFVDNSASSLKHTRNQIPKKRKNDVNYLSLKIKRTQGNSNRRKATKFAKKKKR